METIVSVESLEKSYKNNRVLKGVNFSIAKGSIFALLGSNGAGKTTTVRILSTLSRLDSGKASICGYDVARQAREVKKRISLTGQFAAIDELLTGRENLRLIARLKRVPDVKRKVDELITEFNLEGAADRAASTYSGGMKRRLDIAMGLLGTPEVVFLDEPTTGVDPEGRQEVWRAIKALRDSGTTIFLTTQYLEEAESLSDNIAILHKGTIIANGTLAELQALIPPAKVEYIEKKPSLEEIFLNITGDKGEVRHG